LAAVSIIVFNANTNAPVGVPAGSGIDGSYRIELPPGTYFLKLARQGYEDVPPRDIRPLPLNVSSGQTVTYSVQMFPNAIPNAGIVSGRVFTAGAPAPGVLVIADDSTRAYSSVSSGDGSFYIFNTPTGAYRVKAWRTGFSSTDSLVAVPAGREVTTNVTLTQGVTGSVQGQVTFLATTNIEVDVELTHPRTRETIPGLSTKTLSRNYILNNVPPGTYLARATYENDGKVVDPDWIIKNGEPLVTVGSGTVSRDFSVTGAVTLVSPTNPETSTQPVDVQGARPTFSWAAYSSADHYVVEVINSSGRAIWGGFANNWTVRRVLVPRPQTSIQYNADTSATEPLGVGRIYRWKIYASKNDNSEPTGWKLISASEDQRGLIRIVP
ncbi:MAG: carboxypeptidase-like regulatory domain-containing protein, partial [Bacteroidota bacterium]